MGKPSGCRRDRDEARETLQERAARHPLSNILLSRHTERWTDPEEKIRAEFWAELIYKYEYSPTRLMRLWEFVRANGLAHSDDAPAIRELLATPRDVLVERLRRKNGWKGLTVLVQILPDRSLVPVRAQYPDGNTAAAGDTAAGNTATIGLNFLSASQPVRGHSAFWPNCLTRSVMPWFRVR